MRINGTITYLRIGLIDPEIQLIFGDIHNSYTDHIRKNDHKCCAIVFNHGDIKQCDKCIYKNNLCNHHYNYELKNNKLKYGKV